MRTSFITERAEIDDIIRQCDICFVGLTEPDGTPYVIPMNFGYNGNQLVLHSGPEGNHLNIISQNNKVCISFCTDRKIRCQHPDVACSYSMESRSVMCRGKVSFLNDEDLVEKEKAMNMFMKNYSDRTFRYFAPALRNVKVWIIDIETITAKSFGQNFKTTF